ncbi:hypothetical protein RR48_10516 [Papilio machaon]|uniref:Uncharacterized protein n=1 Tax=Papilio machaon TaxID=76193 RepID=A0A194RAJ9_PAPMA|nr:hypothetical protein RR48_10516 [Papilio machaon]
MQRTATKQRPSSTQKVAEITTPAHSNIYIPQYSELETDSESEYYTYLAHTSLPERKENKTPTRETNTLHSYIEEAKSAHKQAIVNLNNSRNLKREIKKGIENAVKRLFNVFNETIKELESSNLRKNTNSTHLPPSPPPPLRLGPRVVSRIFPVRKSRENGEKLKRRDNVDLVPDVLEGRDLHCWIALQKPSRYQFSKGKSGQ